MNALVLALAYLRHHWVRTIVLVLTIALVLSVPIVTRTLLNGAETSLAARAEATPLLLGARGSRTDLVMATAYFSDDSPEPTTMATADAVWDSGLGIAIPLHTAFESGGQRIVGTSLDYFDARGLTLAEGRRFAILGEAVLGSEAARRLQSGVGKTIVSSPENLFDLDGVYPLEMSVVGVLEPTGTPDDQAIFVDVKTAWVIAGIGHGHEDVVKPGEAGAAVANAAIVNYARITPENIDSFHFHGAPDAYPVTAVLVMPNDTRAATILRGRYLDAEGPVQAVVPGDVIGRLVERLFSIAMLLDTVALVVGVAAALAVGLALFLSWRLRAPEMRTAHALGAGRSTIARLALTEIALILVAALFVAAPVIVLTTAYGDDLARFLIALGTRS